MARCHICNTKLDVVEVDERDGRIKPCGNCQDEIDDATYEMDEELDDYFGPELTAYILGLSDADD